MKSLSYNSTAPTFGVLDLYALKSRSVQNCHNHAQKNIHLICTLSSFCEMDMLELMVEKSTCSKKKSIDQIQIKRLKNNVIFGGTSRLKLNTTNKQAGLRFIKKLTACDQIYKSLFLISQQLDNVLISIFDFSTIFLTCKKCVLFDDFTATE